MSVLAPPRLLSSEVLGSHEVTVLVVTWQHPFTRQISAIGLLSRNLCGVYGFEYIANVLTIEDFLPLVGFPDLNLRYESATLFPLFAQRVMDPRRPDYTRFISSIGLSDAPSPWEQLTHSGGRRAGDTLQLLPVPTPVEGTLGSWEVEFLVHGMRHIAGKARTLRDQKVVVSRESQEHSLAALQAGDELALVPEPGNTVNDKAIVLATGSGVPLGYVPDVFTEDLSKLPHENIRCSAEVVNDASAPWHMRMVAKLVCEVPENFAFFSSPVWQPLTNS